ncbi:MAG: hypothetical protein L0170_04600, partial [Acidobacteria bacterium]|nr:hypothetical protein [Acidobacteriota bacterium]
GKLDGKPLTVRSWADGDWSNYEDENGAGRDGGKDTRASFTSKEPYFLVGAQLRAVRSPAPFVAVKSQVRARAPRLEAPKAQALLSAEAPKVMSIEPLKSAQTLRFISTRSDSPSFRPSTRPSPACRPCSAARFAGRALGGVLLCEDRGGTAGKRGRRLYARG